MEMTFGAFALLDCLGFKGIWKSIPPAAVIDKLSDIDSWASLPETFGSDLIDDRFPTAPRTKVNVTLLSDTIAVSVQPIRDNLSKYFPPYILAQKLVSVVLEINDRFVRSDPKIVLRGCLTLGDHYISDKFIIGPAVDRAAELEKLANGAFIWLDSEATRAFAEYERFSREMIFTPLTKEQKTAILADSAVPRERRLIKVLLSELGEPTKVVSGYRMPIKGGDILKCDIINPLSRIYSTLERNAVLQAYDESMQSGGRIDVAVKHTNTMDFLELCRDEAVEYHSKVLEHLADENLYGLYEDGAMPQVSFFTAVAEWLEKKKGPDGDSVAERPDVS